MALQGRLVDGGRGWEGSSFHSPVLLGSEGRVGWTGVAGPGLGVTLGAAGSGEKRVRQLDWLESTGITS